MVKVLSINTLLIRKSQPTRLLHKAGDQYSPHPSVSEKKIVVAVVFWTAVTPVLLMEHIYWIRYFKILCQASNL